ncbi:MAG: flagellar biosynthesis/type III secretory pathway chaperone [Granulosicoccus sp.]|jgi:flagellar biosynthesis/type III secretory pathway chaperone
MNKASHSVTTKKSEDVQNQMDENTKKQSLEAMKIMVEKDKSVSQQLISLLEHEQTVLKQKDYNSLDAILSKKTPLLDQLKHHANIRRQWLVSLYKVADESQWGEFVASFQRPEISEKWQEVNSNISHCKHLNETNGLLVSRGKKTYEQLIYLLKGGNMQSDVYTAKGNKQSIRAYSSVAKA